MMRLEQEVLDDLNWIYVLVYFVFARRLSTAADYLFHHVEPAHAGQRIHRNVGLPKFLAVGYRALDASAHCFWLHANTRSNQCNATPCFFENQRFALYRYCSIWNEQYKYQYYKLFIYAYITVRSHVSPINTLRNHYSFQFLPAFFLRIIIDNN